MGRHVRLIDDLIRRSKESAAEKDDAPDLFKDFNGIDDPEARLEFYQHDQHWSNRMILGDSLHVMASLAEREHLRGQVQCIYIDPPYGIKFNSNWQVSTLSRDVKDGKREDVSREPVMLSASVGRIRSIPARAGEPRAAPSQRPSPWVQEPQR
jgi:adenine-specific DNA-methyltransferase